MSQEVEDWLSRTLADRHLSRAERQALRASLASPDFAAGRDTVRRRAFELAREALANPEDRTVLEWLEDVDKVLRGGDEPAAKPSLAEVYFSPGEDCPRVIARLLGGARRTVEVCVFTITDDRLAGAVLEAHRRGVAVRVITDDDKAGDLGSDVDRLGRAGIAVRVDRSPYHMHHKFAIFDGSVLLDGSYNWTRGAARDNEENLIVLDEPRLIGPFAARFEDLWTRLGAGTR